MKGYKGFNKDMTCRGMQYEEGKIYKMEEEPKCCERGYHFCENPIDCLGYYSPNESIYRQVEATGEISKDEDTSDTKIATNEIKIGAKIDFQTMVKMAIEFTYKHCTKKGKGNNKRSNKSVASNTGDKSVASNTGYYSVASNTGYKSVASNTGDKSVASNTGDYSVASNTGYYSVASNTGDKSVASNTGDYSVASNLGQKSISSCLGVRGQASGKKGTWLVVAEWIQDEDWNWEVKEVKTVKVDGKKIKEDTYYALENGEFVEKGSASDDND